MAEAGPNGPLTHVYAQREAITTRCHSSWRGTKNQTASKHTGAHEGRRGWGIRRRGSAMVGLQPRGQGMLGISFALGRATRAVCAGAAPRDEHHNIL